MIISDENEVVPVLGLRTIMIPKRRRCSSSTPMNRVAIGKVKNRRHPEEGANLSVEGYGAREPLRSNIMKERGVDGQKILKETRNLFKKYGQSM